MAAAAGARAAMEAEPPVAMCVECEDQEAAVRCEQCDEFYCRPCYQMQHRKGKRRQHQSTSLFQLSRMESITSPNQPRVDVMPCEVMPKPTGEVIGAAADAESSAPSAAGDDTATPAVQGNGDSKGEEVVAKGASAARGEVFDLIPIRLSQRERDLFSVLEGTLQVSEYTDVVDTYRWGKEDRMCAEFDEVLRELVGLLCCNDFKEGSRKAAIEHMDENEEFFRRIFEVGRRYKIMNPEKMRSTYGKLMWMLQDTSCSTVSRHIRMNVVAPIKTVVSVVRDGGVEAMLDDPDFTTATNEIPADLPRAEIDALRKKKDAAMQRLLEKYQRKEFPASEVERVVFSVADSRTYQAIACGPIKAMIENLKKYFPSASPSTVHESLEIGYGPGGSKLMHNHPTQYRFVLQTLTLWHKMCSRMFYLWSAADQDLLDGPGYRLANTGQGLNRVQSCPHVSRVVSGILREVQSEVAGSWVGLSVVHLGDRDVPNALVFIDKYTQVPRILAPIVQTISRLESLAEDPAINAYFEDAFKGVDNLRQIILRDFFRHGFDGSGDDGGSCIDGRLTSAWNWCSKLEKKSYYRVFLLAGFTGFDGDWRAG